MCNCSKKSRIRRIVRIDNDKTGETKDQKSKLGILKEMWESAKKGETDDNQK